MELHICKNSVALISMTAFVLSQFTSEVSCLYTKAVGAVSTELPCCPLSEVILHVPHLPFTEIEFFPSLL